MAARWQEVPVECKHCGEQYKEDDKGKSSGAKCKANIIKTVDKKSHPVEFVSGTVQWSRSL